MKITIEESDALKILDALSAACEHHRTRDESNAVLHLAPTVRYSPLTSALEAARERLATNIEAQTGAERGTGR